MGLDLTFSGEALKAALFFAIFSACVLVGLLTYLNRFTQRRYFTIWNVAWMFYVLWLFLNFTLIEVPSSGLGFVLKQVCVGTAAVFLLWGSAQFLKVRASQVQLGLFMLFLLVWSSIGAVHHHRPFEFQVPIFMLVGATSMLTSWGYLQFRRINGHVGAGLLAGGFLLWGLYLMSFPFLEAHGLSAMAFLLSSILHLFIGVSMLVLVLEEAQRSRDEAKEAALLQLSKTEFFKVKASNTEERYRLLFEQANEGIVLARADDLRLLELNQKAGVLLGVDRIEDTPATLSQFVSAGNSRNKKFSSGAEWFDFMIRQRRVVIERKDGKQFAGEIAGARINLEGELAYQFFLRDLTERTQLEQQLRQSEKLSALGQMISGVAHELNNPLAAIKGYLQLILEGHELPERTRVNLETVAEESNRAAKLVSNFLHFARERPAQRELVNLNDLAARSVEMREYECRVGGIDLKLDLDPHLPETLVDPDQVQQILLNLMTNALHAMTDAMPPHRLAFCSFARDGNVVVEIEDNGPGVPEQLRARIFEPFFTTKEVGTGTGLGLSMAHSIMADHNGRIYFREPSKGGAVFGLEFPVVQSMESQAGEREVVPPPPGANPDAAGGSATVLVLDDERPIAELLKEMLEMLGHETTVCLSPMQALEKIDETSFDVVISDFRMPGMNGQQFYQEVSSRDPELARRIIFLSGDVVNHETQTFIGSTGNLKLDKPFQLENVRHAVETVLMRTKESPAAE